MSSAILNLTRQIFLWSLLIILIGISAGSTSAAFLILLSLVTDFRIANVWVIWLLPLAGLIIGFGYHYWGKEIVKGNNVVIDEFYNPQKPIPLKMMPMIFFGTILTHLFGGSAGREGTAVQMSSSIADQFTELFKLNNENRKLILVLGISAGFSAIFGTPITAAIFALEILVIGKFGLKAFIPSILVAFVADYTCHLCQAKHTVYSIPLIPPISLKNFLLTILVGIIFGLTAFLFKKSIHFFEEMFKEKVLYPPLRPVIGGLFIAIAASLFSISAYLGLGIPTIVNSFTAQQPIESFLIKILLTAYTLGAGFKGGEVTPLFFIGATLGNALFLLIPTDTLPMALLAGMGFVAVFAGATNTPIACTIMGIELFGIDCGLYVGVACGIAYFCSGKSSIYTSQPKRGPKYFLYNRFRKKNNTIL